MQPFEKLTKQEWGRGLHRLCEDLPLSLDGVDDERRGEKVAKIREIIASQWARTIEIARCHGPESIVIQERVSEMNTILQGLMKDYAQVLSFAPNPDLSTTAGVTDMVNLKIGSPNDSSTTESPSSEKEVPFDFKFLQVGDDVWTVLQARCFEKKNDKHSSPVYENHCSTEFFPIRPFWLDLLSAFQGGPQWRFSGWLCSLPELCRMVAFQDALLCLVQPVLRVYAVTTALGLGLYPWPCFWATMIFP